MFFQSFIADFLGIVTAFLTLGALLDSVLTTKVAKKRILNFLSGHAKHKQKPITLEIISVAYQAIFSRFFSSKFLSIRFFVRSAIISLMFVTVYTAVVSLFEPNSFASIDFNNSHQALVIIVALVTNVVVDWITIGQTKVFFSVASKVERPAHALLLIGADVIVTINLFTLLFSQVVAYLLILSVQFGDSIQIKSQTIGVWNKPDLAESIAAAEYDSFGVKQLKDFYRIDLLLEIGNSRGDKQSTTLTLFGDSPDIYVGNLLRQQNVFAVSELQYRTENTLEGVDRDDRQPPTFLNLLRADPIRKTISSDLELKEFEFINLTTQSFTTSFDRGFAYSLVYQAVDAVQDVFPGTLLPVQISIGAGELIPSYIASLFQKDFYLGCYDTGSSNWTVVESFEVLPKAACEKVVVVTATEFAKLVTAIKTLRSDVTEVRIPLNPFFFSSFFITVLLYATMANLYLGQWGKRKLGSYAKLAIPFVRKAPMTIIGFLFGLSLALLTSIPLLFH